jgi:glycosyltransferase involved in cell wall biosynthesis
LKKLDILCVIDDLTAGGAQRQLVNLALGLKSFGHDVSFLTYHKRTFYEQILNEAGINLILIEEPNALKRLLKFRRFIRNSKYTSIISYLGVPSFLASFAAFPRKKFNLIVGERSSNPEIKKSIKSKLIRLFYFKSDFIVANSFSNIELVKSILPWISENKFKVIYNGLNLNKFNSNPDFRFHSNPRFTILIPASYRKLKNLLGLIEAVQLLNKNDQDKLLIQWFGDKSPKGNHDSILETAIALIEQYTLQDVFQLNDATHDVAEKMKLADAVGLFSFFEGLPNAICEGMACGKPIIATKVSDVPLLIEDGVNGFICEANQPETISNSIKKLLSLNTQQLSSMGFLNRNKAEKLFDEITINRTYEELLMKN